VGNGCKKTPPPEAPDWKKLEIVIEGIQRFLAPGAEVRRNEKVRGRSGRLRQLDVTISQRVGSIPLFIVLECKRYTRPVGIEKVEAFVTKLGDVDADVGVMISSSGFDQGALASAKENKIYLKTYREADETDFWKRFVRADSWLNLMAYEPVISHVSMFLQDGRRFDNVPDNLALFDEHGNRLVDIDGDGRIVEDEFMQGFYGAARPRPIGTIELTLGGAHPTQYTRTQEGFFAIDRFVIRGTITAKRYPINVQLMAGHLIETADLHNLEYIRARLGPVDIPDVMENNEGIPLSNEEWLAWEQSRSIEHTISLSGRYDILVEAHVDGERNTER
jgi:hypothetical protein